METDEITQVVWELVARRAGRAADEVPTDTPLTELGVDSLGIAALIVDLESHFSFRLPAAAITRETFHSVESVTAAVRGLAEVR